MNLNIEKGVGFKNSIKDFTGNLNSFTITTGFITVFIVAFVAASFFVSALGNVDLTFREMSSWFFIVFVLGGLTSIILSLYYKQPIAGAWSVPGLILVATSMQYLSYREAIFGFLIANLIVLVLGLSGAIRITLKFIPLPIFASMISGMLLVYVLGFVEGFTLSPIIGLAMIAGYFVFHKIRKTPGILGSLIFGIIAAVITGDLTIGQQVTFVPTVPVLQTPAFAPVAIFSISIPLALLIIGAENMQAIGVLKSVGYKPPINAMTIFSGAIGMLSNFFGGHNANIAGPTTAVCASPESGRLEGRYVAAVLGGIVYIIFGVFANTFVGLIGGFPEAIVHILLALVLMSILGSTFIATWKDGSFVFGPIVAFIIAFSGITIFGISAPFWALFFGCLVSLGLETDHYKKYIIQG